MAVLAVKDALTFCRMTSAGDLPRITEVLLTQLNEDPFASFRCSNIYLTLQASSKGAAASWSGRSGHQAIVC